MFIFSVCTGNKSVYFLWLHRNNVYYIAALQQLSRVVVVHKGKLRVLKNQMDYLLIFRLSWTDWFDLHMQFGHVS